MRLSRRVRDAQTGRVMSDRSSSLWTRFAAAADAEADRPAILAGSRMFTYRDLRRDADARALRLEAGIGSKAPIVALSMPNGVEVVATLLALFRLGATVLLASPRYGGAERAAIREQAAPTLWLSDPELTTWEEWPEGPTPLDRTDAVVKFTSGSSGIPKGVRLRAEDLLTEAEQVASALGLNPRDRVVARVPLLHSYGFDLGVLAPLLHGASLSTGEGFVPRAALDELLRGEATVFLGVPNMYRFWMEGRGGPVDLSFMRWMLSCTAPLLPDRIASFHERFGIWICQHYGSSETGALTQHRPEAVPTKLGSIGRAVPGVTLCIEDTDGRARAPGEEGEVVVTSGAMARGYLTPPEGRNGFVRGRFHTGDLGTMDEDGYLTLRGRIDATINVGGLKVSPLEVVRVLESCPAVREAFVLGLPDAHGEESVVAVVTLSAPASEKEILAYCHGRLADYKLPRRIEIREVMPLGPSGKVRILPEDLAP